MSIGYFQWTKIGCFRWTRSGCFRRTLTLDMGNSSILSTDFCVCYISQANNKPGESLIAFSRFVVLFPVLSAPHPAAHPNNADPRR